MRGNRIDASANGQEPAPDRSDKHGAQIERHGVDRIRPGKPRSLKPGRHHRRHREGESRLKGNQKNEKSDGRLSLCPEARLFFRNRNGYAAMHGRTSQGRQSGKSPKGKRPPPDRERLEHRHDGSRAEQAADAEHRCVDAHHLRLTIGKGNLDDGRHPYVQACDRNTQNQSARKESRHPLRTSDKRPERDACERGYCKRPAPELRDERKHRQTAQPEGHGRNAREHAEGVPGQAEDFAHNRRHRSDGIGGTAHDERGKSNHEEDLISTVPQGDPKNRAKPRLCPIVVLARIGFPEQRIFTTALGYLPRPISPLALVL